MFTYKTIGVCSREIHFDIVDGGCPGNLAAIGKLVEGQDAKSVADLLKGNDCRGRGTSCTDQLAKAISEHL